VQTGRALTEAGLHPASGGDGTLACSGDMLLEALVACAGVTLRSVAVNREISLTGGRVTAEGDLDFRGTMAVDREAPVGFAAIRLRFELGPELSDDDRETLLTLTERYCVVLQTIRTSAKSERRKDQSSRLNAKGWGKSVESLYSTIRPVRLARVTSMSPQYSHMSWRHGPHGVPGSGDCVTTAMAVNVRSPAASADNSATRSAQTVRP